MNHNTLGVAIKTREQGHSDRRHDWSARSVLNKEVSDWLKKAVLEN